MPVLLIENDPFAANAATFADQKDEPSPSNMRRPLWGMVSKLSPKHVKVAYLTVMAKNGKKIGTHNSSAPGGYGESNSNFIINSIDIARSERAQVLSTFGDTYAFFFGQSPQVLSVSGFLFNTIDFNWKEEWLRNYEDYLRGTRCVETRSRVYLGYDDTLIEGYLMGTSVGQQAEQPNLAPFNFSMLVTNWVYLSAEAQEELPNIGAEYVYAAETTRTMEMYSASREQGHYIEYPLGQPTNLKGSQYDATTGELVDSKDIWAQSATPVKEQIPSWIANWDSQSQAFLDEEGAMREIDIQSYMTQKGVTRTQAAITWASDPAQFPLSGRADSTESLSKSLGKNASNSASVIPDQPTPS